LAGYAAKDSGALCQTRGIIHHQFACQPLFYLKAFSRPASNTRCAWPKRMEFIILQTNSVQEQSQWVGTAGEVLRHDSIYKRSDWKASVTGSVDISSERHKLCTLPGSFGCGCEYECLGTNAVDRPSFLRTP